ncbi:hypothetical protein GGI25_000834 [Coemansia spiralis]|uniref:HSF-type DNA-binding domain-containing protein n=1 Tax=Coemansia spiralis TaxID=417178 RepID=A0A9W8G7B0_9FUNG|nr:hypothetical protein GGI25_000834 [Coemansia spiralis]
MFVPYIVEAAVFEKPADLLCPPQSDHISSSSTDSTMAGSASPVSSAGKGAIASGYSSSVTTWAPATLEISGLDAAKAALAADSSDNNSPSFHTNTSAALMPYPTPEQVSLKASEFASSFGFDYGNTSMGFDSANMSASANEMPAAKSLAISTSIAGLNSQPDLTAEITPPPALHISLHTPPQSLSNVMNNQDVSPVCTMPETVALAPQAMGDTHSISSVLHSGATSMLPPLSSMDVGAGISSFAAEMPLDSRSSFMHVNSYGSSQNGSGMENAGNSSAGFSSADNNFGQHGLATRRPSPNSGIRTDSALFPSLLHRICEDHAFDKIAYWDENNYVCIPVMETLRVQLNNMGMTAHHTDSLQKNFNDYQFKRMTDQRRIRHTSEQGIVKFQNPNFLPGREDLLHLVVRKSALKKLQNANGRDRIGGNSVSRKKSKTSVRQASGRAMRMSISERMNPYSRFGNVDPNSLSGFQMPLSPTSSFQSQHGSHPGSISQVYSTSDNSNVLMPIGVQDLGFGIQNHVGVNDNVDQSMLPANTAQYFQPQFYMDQSSSNLVMQNFIPQSQVSLQGSFQQANGSQVTQQQGYQRLGHSPQQQYNPVHSVEFEYGHQQDYMQSQQNSYYHQQYAQQQGSQPQPYQQLAPIYGGGDVPQNGTGDSIDNGSGYRA